MGNPLVDLQKLVGVQQQKTFTAKVTKVVGDKVWIKLSTGNTMIVWGALAKVNDTVLILGKQIVAVINEQNRPTVHVP